MKSLSVDLETRSSVDIGKSGVYRYAEAEDFAILLFGLMPVVSAGSMSRRGMCSITVNAICRTSCSMM